MKKIPLIGLGAGILFGAQRALAGDFVGAGMELASGAAGTVPGLGTAASVAIDAALVAKDVGAFDGVGEDGVVKGDDVGDKDTVDTKLTVGETVVPRKASEDKNIKPFLNDIINNEGALFKAMDTSFKMQEQNILMFGQINEKFDNVLESFEKIIDGMKSGSGGLTSSGGGSNTSASTAASSISPPTTGGGSDPSNKLAPPSKSSEGKMTTLPMIPSKTPQSINMDDSTNQNGDSVPIIGAEDPDNFYIEFMKSQFGIFGA